MSMSAVVKEDEQRLVNGSHGSEWATYDEETGDIANDDFAEAWSFSHKTSVPRSVFSLVCTTVGAGVLVLPKTLGEAGWMGLLVLVLVAACSSLTAVWLGRCMFSIPGKRLKTYEEIGVAAMGPHGRTLVGVFQTVTLYGACCVYLKIMGEFMNLLVGGKVGTHVWIFVFGVVMIPVSWLRTVKEISYLAVVGVGASLAVAAVTIVKGLQSGADDYCGKNDCEHVVVGAIGGWSQCFNLLVFGFSCHSVLPAIVNEMKAPKLGYVRATVWSFIIDASLYSITAICGYYGYGSNTANPAVAPSPILAEKDAGAKLACAAITLHVLMAYPLVLNPVCIYIGEAVGINHLQGKSELASRILVRSTMVVGTILIASVVPFFDNLLSLVSALSVVATSFIFPTIFYYQLNKNNLGGVEKALMAFVLVLGVLGSIAGVYYACDDLRTNARGNPFEDYWNK